MSSDSESDDDIQMKQFLEAADTTLLNNAMFQNKEETNIDDIRIAVRTEEAVKNDLPKSQRYIVEDNDNSGTDFNLPESMQRFLAKKLSDILKQHYEFSEINTEENSIKTKTKYKSRVKLLKGDSCFVKPYEDFEYETKGPEQKPNIKRRIVDKDAENKESEDVLKSLAIDGNYILSGAEVNMWAKKKERKDKVFHYKMGKDGVLYAKEEIN
ncbi:uncharacterized protein LOC111680630 [Lucilia cuprina]|uniref:uncharacterized protein LOC111680630 n=1 Tax=Lucilia cuprina TaxID=7375 RepID=UPI000C71A6A5|nr:uncharacterized protein LOC111680630 [Lucilia cuprina]KAI8125566.1 hypothetical protein CVS40_4177 [Lucilia cuprina]